MEDSTWLKKRLYDFFMQPALVAEDDLLAGRVVIQQAAVEGDDRLDERDLGLQPGLGDHADRLAELRDEDLLGLVREGTAALDKNTVDMDRERANFVDNAVRFEATLRFINNGVSTMLSAIKGQ